MPVGGFGWADLINVPIQLWRGIAADEAQRKAYDYNQQQYEQGRRYFEQAGINQDASWQKYIEDTNADLNRYREDSGARWTAGMEDVLSAYEKANTENRGAYSGVMSDFERDADQLNRMAAERTQDVLSSYNTDAASGLANYASRRADLVSDYGQRTARGMSMLRGLGDQEKADIEASYAGEQDRALADLIGRGAGGSTIASMTRAGIEREKTSAVSRQQARVRDQLFGAYAGLSGEELAAKTGLTGDEAAAFDRYASGRSGLYAGLTGDQLNTASDVSRRRTDVGTGWADLVERGNTTAAGARDAWKNTLLQTQDDLQLLPIEQLSSSRAAGIGQNYAAMTGLANYMQGTPPQQPLYSAGLDALSGLSQSWVNSANAQRAARAQLAASRGNWMDYLNPFLNLGGMLGGAAIGA